MSAPALRAGFKRERMQGAADLALQRGIDQLVLAHARQSLERARGDPGAIVISVSREILDVDLGVGKSLSQFGLQVGGGHRHPIRSSTTISELKPLTSPGGCPNPGARPAKP